MNEAARTLERLRRYALLAHAFAFPTPHFYEEIASGHLARALDLGGTAELNLSYDRYQTEYLRTFEVARGRPPCPPYEGYWRGEAVQDRREIMEELVRFYEYFGLTLGSRPKELPDHLSVELEFMGFLTFKEAQALDARRDPSPYRRAQRDFLARHPMQWLPLMREGAESSEILPLFEELIVLADELVSSHAQALAHQGIGRKDGP